MSRGEPLEHAVGHRSAKQVAEGVVGHDERHGGQRVTLAEAATMKDGGAWDAIVEDACASRAEQDAHPFAPASAKAEVVECVEEEGRP